MVEGAIPAIREGANMVVVDDKVIVFGGRGVRQRYNDIYILDTKVELMVPCQLNVYLDKT